MKRAEVRSPEPFAVIGSRGVRTTQAPLPVTASISIVSSGRSGRSTEVTSTVDGPIAIAASAEASVDSRLSGCVPVRNPSSNWFGVMMSACGTTCSRMIGGIAGSTKQPLVALPITGSQVYVAAGFAALTRATASRMTSPISSPPWYPDSTASTSPSTPRSSIPVITSRTSSAASSGPRHAPYPVWLEKTTVSTGHTSWPSLWSGKTAAELPTWP